MTTMFFDLFKVSKMTNHYDLFKLAVLNKAIQGAFFKSQKSKNRLKRHRFLFTWEKQWQIKRSMALF